MEVEDIQNEIVIDCAEDSNILLCSSFTSSSSLKINHEKNDAADIKTESNSTLEFNVFLESADDYNAKTSEKEKNKKFDDINSVEQELENNRTSPLSDENKHDCIKCKITFPTEQQLRTHLYYHEKESDEVFTCGICNKDFKKLYHLKNHIRIHFLEKKFMCDVCHKTFAFVGHLKNHVSVHTGEKNYNCTVCTKTFRQKGHLINHLRIHMGLKKFSCPVCDRKFTQNIHMKNHLKTHTGEKNYKCKICCKGFIQSGQLDNHMTIHTGERKYECQHCGMRFKQVGHLIGHFKTHNKLKL